MIEVRYHKTLSSNGVSCLPLKPFQVDWIDIYISKISINVPGIKHIEHIFVKSNGSKFTSGDVSNHLATSWRIVGLGHTSAAIFRKSTVTSM